MGSSLPLTLINTVLYFSYLFINFFVTFFKHRNSLIIGSFRHSTLIVYPQGSNIDLTPFTFDPIHFGVSPLLIPMPNGADNRPQKALIDLNLRKTLPARSILKSLKKSRLFGVRRSSACYIW